MELFIDCSRSPSACAAAAATARQQGQGLGDEDVWDGALLDVVVAATVLQRSPEVVESLFPKDLVGRLPMVPFSERGASSVSSSSSGSSSGTKLQIYARLTVQMQTVADLHAVMNSREVLASLLLPDVLALQPMNETVLGSLLRRLAGSSLSSVAMKKSALTSKVDIQDDFFDLLVVRDPLKLKSRDHEILRRRKIHIEFIANKPPSTDPKKRASSDESFFTHQRSLTTYLSTGHMKLRVVNAVLGNGITNDDDLENDEEENDPLQRNRKKRKIALFSPREMIDKVAVGKLGITNKTMATQMISQSCQHLLLRAENRRRSHGFLLFKIE